MRQPVTLVAGASGRLGREVVRALKMRGHRVRGMTRSPRQAEMLREIADEVIVADALNPASLSAALAGVERVFSCLGASVIPLARYGWRTFTDIDFPANRNLIDAAVQAQAERFVYVSVFGAERLPEFDFVRGHEEAVHVLRRSGLDYRVIRPTGFFSAMEEILTLANRGLLPEFRHGTARTNPIHEADLAVFCADAIEGKTGGIREMDVGGPEILTRREIATLAFQAMGKEPRLLRVPVETLQVAGTLLRPVQPRIGHLMLFIAAVLASDFTAPQYGERMLKDYFTLRAKTQMRRT